MIVMNTFFGLSGLMFIFIGYLIWGRKHLSLIAGYDEKKIKDKNGLAKFEGFNSILMGVLIILISVYGILLEKNTIIPYVLVVVFMCIRIAVGYKKFEKR